MRDEETEVRAAGRGDVRSRAAERRDDAVLVLGERRVVDVEGPGVELAERIDDGLGAIAAQERGRPDPVEVEAAAPGALHQMLQPPAIALLLAGPVAVGEPEEDVGLLQQVAVRLVLAAPVLGIAVPGMHLRPAPGSASAVEEDGAQLHGPCVQELGAQRVDELGIVGGIGHQHVGLVVPGVEQITHDESGPALEVERRQLSFLRARRRRGRDEECQRCGTAPELRPYGSGWGSRHVIQPPPFGAQVRVPPPIEGAAGRPRPFAAAVRILARAPRSQNQRR